MLLAINHADRYRGCVTLFVFVWVCVCVMSCQTKRCKEEFHPRHQLPDILGQNLETCEQQFRWQG